MQGNIDNTNNFLGNDNGKSTEQKIQDKTGFDMNQPSTDAYGNQGQPGQFGQEGQYGAVTGKGFGGGFAGGAKPAGDKGKSNYEGYEQHDSTASGGYGTNAAGNSFSRDNQRGADNQPGAEFEDDEGGAGYKTGTSTPGYRQEGDVDAQAAENRMKNQNMNVYGKQADDRGSTGNDYNEAI